VCRLCASGTGRVRGIMFGITIILFAIFCLLIIFIQNNRHKEKIYEKIKSINGTVISIERSGIFSDIGPFMVVGKGRTIYRIEYKVGNEIKEGWVRFGGFFGPDWRL